MSSKAEEEALRKKAKEIARLKAEREAVIKMEEEEARKKAEIEEIRKKAAEQEAAREEMRKKAEIEELRKTVKEEEAMGAEMIKMAEIEERKKMEVRAYRKKKAETEEMRKMAEMEAARKAAEERKRFEESAWYQRNIIEKRFEGQLKRDKDLFNLYKAESEAITKQKEDEQQESINNINITETSSIGKMILYSDINSIFGDISMSHDELQKLSQKFSLLHIESKKRALHEIVKKIKMSTFTRIWNGWCHEYSSMDCNEYSLIEIAFKYYQYVGILCCWRYKEDMIDRYDGGYDEYTEHSLWCIHSNGNMYMHSDKNSTREDIKTLKFMKQISRKHIELLISYLICYQLHHKKSMYSFKNYGKQIAEWYGLTINHYKYDRYKMGKDLFLFIKNELEIDYPNNFD